MFFEKSSCPTLLNLALVDLKSELVSRSYLSEGGSTIFKRNLPLPKVGVTFGVKVYVIILLSVSISFIGKVCVDKKWRFSCFSSD